MSVAVGSPALRAIEVALELLADAGITATDDAGAFYPQPTGVLVGLPSQASRGLASRTYTLPVLVVSADPLNSALARQRIYALADDVAFALHADNFRTSSWAADPNAAPHPALEVTLTVSIAEEAP